MYCLRYSSIRNRGNHYTIVQVIHIVEHLLQTSMIAAAKDSINTFEVSMLVEESKYGSPQRETHDRNIHSSNGSVILR
jgi:hypothetical protein